MKTKIIPVIKALMVGFFVLYALLLVLNTVKFAWYYPSIVKYLLILLPPIGLLRWLYWRHNSQLLSVEFTVLALFLKLIMIIKIKTDPASDFELQLVATKQMLQGSRAYLGMYNFTYGLINSTV